MTQTTGADVRLAGDVERLVGPITLAFATDPFLRYFFPDPGVYLEAFPQLVRAVAGRAVEHDVAYEIGSSAAAALWLPPGVEPDRESIGPLFERTIEPRRLATIMEAIREKGTYHPTEPHWYLHMIGVDPQFQGRGFGTALLRHALERIDEAHEVACLDSSNPANIPLYERFGFEVKATVVVGDAPAVVPMVRPAR